MSFLRAALAVARKDLRIELRAREVVLSMTLFSALILLVFAFAFVREGRASTDGGAGILWIAIALAGLLGLGRAFDREREGDTLSALLLAPIPRAAIYAGKLAGILAFLAVTELVATPLLGLLLDLPLGAHPLAMALLLGLGTLGFAAVGSLFSAALIRNRGRHVLLAILVYPIILPVLMAGARGTQALTAIPADFEAFWLWTKMLLLFDVTFVVLALWVFDPMVSGD